MSETVQLTGSRGTIAAKVGDTFHDRTYGGDWCIERFDTGDRLYSPSGLGGTFIIRCRPISDMPPYWKKYLEEDGTVLWCADSVASCMLTPSPQPREVGSVPCPCTLIEQDEDCPVGYPSMICGICKGKGHTTPDQVTALACEMIKIASDVGEPDDPFAAWESIDLVKSQNGQLRKALSKIADMLDDEDADLDHAIAISTTALATMEGSDNG